jgi:tRNA dimethylallyltransferase
VSSRVLALVGPTASGKTGLAIALAQELSRSGNPVEIVNGDAMQLYSHMNIGTAKVSLQERGGIPHHLFDAITPAQEMTAVEYQRRARTLFDDIQSRGATPLLVGGSMFYVSAALDELDFAPTDPKVRASLEREAEQAGPGILFDRLAKLDPATAESIPKQNVRRVIRALEVIEITGDKYANALPEPSYARPTLTLGIEVDRELLKARIASRVEQMWQDGLVEEARSVSAEFSLSKTAAKAIGYAQALAQVDGLWTQQEAIQQTIQLTNRYARRQMSWFRRDKRIVWLDGSGDLLNQALERIRLSQ